MNNSRVLQSSRMAFFILLMGAFCYHSTIAQSGKGYLLIAISPDNAIVRIDTSLHTQRKSHMVVDTGSYIIRAWAPGRIMITDTLHVKESPPVLFRRKLEYTPEYRDFKREMFSYNLKMTNWRYIPGGLTIAAAIYFTINHQVYKSDAKRYKEDADESKAIYDILTDEQEIEFYKSKYLKSREQHSNAINRANDNRKLAMIIVPAGIITTGALYFLSKKIVKPVFEETPALSGLTFDYKITGIDSGPRLNYSYKF